VGHWIEYVRSGGVVPTRVIVDQKIPFELIALETEIDLLPSFEVGESVRLQSHTGISDAERSSKATSNTQAAKKEFKKVLGTPASGKKIHEKTQKTPLSKAL
jgi:hypothetical protein